MAAGKSFASGKSYNNRHNPITIYAEAHSEEFPDAYNRLAELTLTMSHGMMMGAPEVVRLNQNLIRSIGGKRCIDVGVFTGISSLGAALAIPEDGQVISCDVSKEYTDVGRPYFAEAGVAHKIDIRIAPALETLDALLEQGEEGKFDFAFIDADKVNYTNYYERCMRLLRPGGIITIDNTIWSGKVADEAVQDESTVAIRNVNKVAKDDPRCHNMLLNIGDGLHLIFKK